LTRSLKTTPHHTQGRNRISGSSFSEHQFASEEASLSRAVKEPIKHSLLIGKLNMKAENVTGFPTYFTFLLAWTIENSWYLWLPWLLLWAAFWS